MAEVAAALCASSINSAIADKGRSVVALAGGSTPASCYRHLARAEIDWAKVILVPGDERCVAEDDPEANLTMFRADLLNRIPGGTKPEYVGPPLGVAPHEASLEWSRSLEQLALDGPLLDLALLGIGEDGHTASLFPDSDELDASGLTVAVTDSPKPPPGRATLTLSVLAEASERIVLATGPRKADAVSIVLQGPSPHWPVSLLPDLETLLICDQDAAPAD